jgi:hypothetical protein
MKNLEESREYYFDVLLTRDSHDIYWLYSRTRDDYKWVNGTRYPTNTIDPDELYVNEYEFIEACEDIVKQGKKFVNYVPEIVSKEDIQSWLADLHKSYPFEEGDTYYTIEDGEVVESCWDEVSEEIYDYQVENEEVQLYFPYKEDAEKHLNSINQNKNAV